MQQTGIPEARPANKEARKLGCLLAQILSSQIVILEGIKAVRNFSSKYMMLSL